ncbi:MAG TPA: PAS domain S-box protein [Anaerolineaceae bacterium]|nr:PAS domain S-box protein [Anaerolineaceae bacterium]HPN53127.1 PAS domain S-box protein [Anaerolineaceae bacterium]
MARWTFPDLVDVARLQRMANHLYAAGGIPVGILDPNDGTIYVKAGWQNLCVYFHRTHPVAGRRCLRSDAFINQHILSHPQTHSLAYKCENHLWDIANPIIIDGQHVATLFVGQFYYDDETPDLEIFRQQAAELGYDEEEYMAAVRQLPVFSRERVDEMMAYYMDLIQTLVENGAAKIQMQRANEKLAADQKRFEDLVRMLPVGVYETDEDGRVIFINQVLCSMLGVKEGQPDALSLSIQTMMLPQDVERVRTDWAKAIAEGGLYNLSYTIRRQDGSTFPAMLSITPVHPGAERSGMRGVVVDLSMQAAAEKALKESQERFELAMEASRDGIWDWDLESGLIYFSPNYTRMLGYDEGEIPNQITRWQTLIHPDDVGALMQMAYDCIDGRLDFLENEFRMRAKTGNWLWIYSRGKVARDPAGKAVRFIGTQVDLTEQRSALEAVQRSEKDYRMLFETMAQGVVYHAPDGRIVSVNPAACRILGLSEDQLLGRTSMDPRWCCIHEDGSDFPGPEHPAMRSFATGQPVEGVIMGVYNPKLDAYRWMVVNSMPEFLPGEVQPYRVFATITDITELRQVKLQKQANETLFISLFNNMAEGVALHELIYEDGRAVNYRLIDINPQYEKILHLDRENVAGKLSTEVYGTSEPPYLFSTGQSSCKHVKNP